MRFTIFLFFCDLLSLYWVLHVKLNLFDLAKSSVNSSGWHMLLTTLQIYWVDLALVFLEGVSCNCLIRWIGHGSTTVLSHLCSIEWNMGQKWKRTVLSLYHCVYVKYLHQLCDEYSLLRRQYCPHWKKLGFNNYVFCFNVKSVHLQSPAKFLIIITFMVWT